MPNIRVGGCLGCARCWLAVTLNAIVGTTCMIKIEHLGKVGRVVTGAAIGGSRRMRIGRRRLTRCVDTVVVVMTGLTRLLSTVDQAVIEHSAHAEAGHRMATITIYRGRNERMSLGRA